VWHRKCKHSLIERVQNGVRYTVPFLAPIKTAKPLRAPKVSTRVL
jgi:hypothetical protein